MKRIYISGPITGLPQLNFPAFNAEAVRLRGLGYEVVNPAEINPDQGADWNTCLRADLLQLLTCDTLALLPGWHGSAGAHLETHVAHRVGIRVVDAPAIILKREEFLHAHNGMPDVRFVDAEPTTAEQDAWHAGIAAGRDIERGNAAPAAQGDALPLLAKDHTSMRVDYSGLLKQACGALTHGIKEPALAEMLRHLQGHIQELGQRWYAGDTAAVDEFLQLYCVEDDARETLKESVNG